MYIIIAALLYTIHITNFRVFSFKELFQFFIQGKMSCFHSRVFITNNVYTTINSRQRDLGSKSFVLLTIILHIILTTYNVHVTHQLFAFHDDWTIL